MIIMDFTKLYADDIIISDVSVIRQNNSWNICSHPKGRGFNGFLLLISGECSYTCEDETIKLLPNGLIYLPKGAKHTVTAPERSLMI